MNIIPFISLVSSIICLLIGILIYRKDKKNQIHKMFFVLCIIFTSTWGIIEFGYRHTSDIEVVNSFLKINIFWYFVMPLFLHFILLATENKHMLKRKMTYVLLYVPALFFLIADATTDTLLEIPTKVEWGWALNPENPFVYHSANSWALLIGLIALLVSIKFFYDAENYDKKMKAKFILMGLFYPVVIGSIISWLFPIMGVRNPISFVPLLTIGLGFMSYGIWKYEPSYNKFNYEEIKAVVDKMPDDKNIEPITF